MEGELMADYESRDLATAARLAHEAMTDPGDDDRPTSYAELYEDERVKTALRLAKRDARREAIAEVAALLRSPGANWYDDGSGRVDGEEFAEYIEQRLLWTPTDHGYDEEAGW